MCERQPLHCIIPPFMLDSIAQRGSAEQQSYARRCIDASNRLRSQRLTSASAGPQISSEGAMLAGGKERIVYSAGFGTSLPGQRLRGEGEPPTGDAAADEAYEGSGDTYDLFDIVFGRASIDGNNLRLDSTVHYGRGFDNAFWDGRQMVYGDGDEDLPTEQRIFNRFTASLDVIGHELTHGVTQYTANLAYQGQSGAMNEHFSDVFGTLVKQWKLAQAAADADWLIGAELLTANVRGDAIRSMRAPGTAYDDPVLGRDPQPAHMRDYVTTTQDNGGVHINSGILNLAFYRIAIAIGGYAWEAPGAIWYRALTSSRLSDNAEFQDLADLTAEIARAEYGGQSRELAAVVDGWAAAGLIAGTSPGDNGSPSPEPSPAERPGCNPFGRLFAR